MWKNVTEWSAKRKVILFVIVGFLVLAAIGQLTLEGKIPGMIKSSW